MKYKNIYARDMENFLIDNASKINIIRIDTDRKEHFSLEQVEGTNNYIPLKYDVLYYHVIYKEKTKKSRKMKVKA